MAKKKTRNKSSKKNYRLSPVDVLGKISKDADYGLTYRKCRRVGRSFKMPITYFLHEIFRINEMVSKPNRMTDDQILDQILKEYKDHPSILAIYDPEEGNLVAKKRSEYNRGKLNGTVIAPPERDFVSFRYDRDGIPIHGRGLTPLSKDQMDVIRDKYASYREEYDSRMEAIKNQ